MATNLTGSATPSSSTTECDLCGEDGACVHCKECQMALCAKCVKMHKKVPATKNHILEPMSKDTTLEGSAYYDESDDIFCSNHPTNAVTMICDDCADVYCPSCAHVHLGHTAIPVTADVHLLQQITMESLQNMIVGFKGLGQRQQDITSHSNLYEDAVKTVKIHGAEVVNAANDYVDSLCKDIIEEKTNTDLQLSGPKDSISNRLAKTDEQISKLNMIKTSVHRHMLLRGIKQSAATHKLNKEYMVTSKRYENVPSVDRILPSIGKTEDVKKLMKEVFKMNMDYYNLVDFSTFVSVDETHVGSTGWRICDDGVSNYSDMIMYHWDYRNISKYSGSLSKITDTSSNRVLAHLVKISDKQYVSAHQQNVTILDNTFQEVRTKNDQYDADEYASKTICSNGRDSFIECCIDCNKPYKLQINKVAVKNNDFQSNHMMSFEVSDRNQCNFIFCRKRDDILVVSQKQQLYIINLQTKDVSTHDVSGRLCGDVWSLCLEAPGFIMVGDTKSVHVYKDSMEYVAQINVTGKVHGIVFVNNVLFISREPTSGTVLQKYAVVKQTT